MKACSKCSVVKPFEMFTPQKEMRDGWSSWCKRCKAELEAQRRLTRNIRPRAKPIVSNGSKKECLWCHQVLGLSSFPRNKRGRCGRGSYCTNCTRQYHRQPKFRTKHRDATRRYRAKHQERWRFLHRCNMAARRASKRNADTGRVTKEFLLKLYETEICHYCRSFTPRECRTMDHIKPLSKGGLHDPNNLVMACGSCNFSKNNRDLETFLQEVSQ